jgi:hypothetical protein
VSLLVIPRLYMNYSVKSVDGLCCQLSLAQTGKRSQRIEPGGDLVDAPSMNRGRAASVAGQKGLQQIGKLRPTALPHDETVWLHAQ